MPASDWVTAVQRVDKPWGYEEIFAVVEGRYVGKKIHVAAGHALSLQYHLAKDEVIAVIAGHARLEIGRDKDSLETVDLFPGDSVHVYPGVLHRLAAVEDVVFVEASSADEGWREDVVRLDDKYGREGTSAP